MALRDDLVTVYSFLTGTGESNLRKMFVDGKGMTEAHFRMLMRIVKGSNEEQFCNLVAKNEIPRIKLSAQEIALKENFWNICVKTLESRGLVSQGGIAEIGAAVEVPVAAPTKVAA